MANPTQDRSWGDVVLARPWITAKGLRALGRPVPKSVDDTDVIVLTESKEPR